MKARRGRYMLAHAIKPIRVVKFPARTGNGSR